METPASKKNINVGDYCVLERYPRPDLIIVKVDEDDNTQRILCSFLPDENGTVMSSYKRVKYLTKIVDYDATKHQEIIRAATAPNWDGKY
jgi:hypothetical protein